MHILLRSIWGTFFKRGERSTWEKCMGPKEKMTRNVCYFHV